MVQPVIKTLPPLGNTSPPFRVAGRYDRVYRQPGSIHFVMERLREEPYRLELGSIGCFMNENQLQRSEGGVFAPAGRSEGNQGHFRKMPREQAKLLF